MSVIAIDPGLNAMGISVWSDEGELLFYETHNFSKKDSQEKRLNEQYCIISATGKSFSNVTDVIVESQFVQIMGQQVGVIRAAAGSFGAKTTTFVPKSWKKAATGRGNISEEDLRDFIVGLFPQLKDEPDDTIDAVGIYIAYRNKVLNNDQSPKKTIKRKKVLPSKSS